MAYALTKISAKIEFTDGLFITTRSHEVDVGSANPDQVVADTVAAYALLTGSAIKRFTVTKSYTDASLTPVAGNVVTRMGKLNVALETPGKSASFFIPGIAEFSDPGVDNELLTSGRNVVVTNSDLVALMGHFTTGALMEISDGEDLQDTANINSGEIVTIKSNTRKA